MAKEYDNNLIGVASRYAKALVEVATDKNCLDEVIQELSDFNTMYSTSSELKNVLNLPTVKIEEKESVLKEILGSFKSNIVKDFLYLLVQETRFDAFTTICYCLKQEVNLKKGLLEVQIKSAVELDEEQKNRLKEKLEQKTGKSVELFYSLSPEIIGGLVIAYNDKTIDLSISSKFENLTKQLK